LNRVLNYLAAIILLTFSTFIAASNTSGVHGPGVKEGGRGMQLRFALSPGDEDGQEDNWAYRLHYQHAFNNEFRGRVILQYRDRGRFQYEYIRAEMLYNFKKRAEHGHWSSAVRFDIRQRRSDNPEMIAVNWTNQWDLSNGVRIRGILIGAWEFGSDRASSGTAIETRSSVTKKLDGGLTVGIEMFNDFGRFGDFGSFNNQSHQIGPMFGGSIGGVKYQVRYLAGVSNGARDHNVGLRFNKAF
jgi:hypothetical protein